MRAVVLDDDFVVGGEMVFDFEAIGEAKGERRDEFGGIKLCQNCLLVARADAEEEIGLAEEGQAESPVIDAIG